MKGFALLLLCAVAAVQGRSADVQVEGRALAARGENPWMVHLRLAVATSGFLNSCAGAIVNARWVLTSANCVLDSRFIWIRYGAVNVFNPELVTESSIAPQISAGNVLALVNLNRNVQPSQNISPAQLARDYDIPNSGRVCRYGETEDGNAGFLLFCSIASYVRRDTEIEVVLSDGQFSRFDIGTPIVADGHLIGTLTISNGTIAYFRSPVSFIDWIEFVIRQ